MIEIQGFEIKEEIYNGSTTLIYKAVDVNKNKPVIIKLLKSEYPTPEELKNFKYEYKIANSLLGINGIIEHFEIINYKNTEAIIMEDFGGEALDKILRTKKINIKSFLVIAIKLGIIIEEIHNKHIIHKDIKPQNVLMNLQTSDVRIIDFGISSQLSKEVQTITSPDNLEGTLAYISPEQTGRMNRPIDYRTDFYSLGILFYEMLAGAVPFITDDPVELVYAHITKIPEAPYKKNAEIPKVISDIVMKLLEKTAEKRYQSTSGLRSDLEKCYTMLKQTGKIEDFKIGQNDISSKFQIPEKLYGRDEEVNKLLSSFNHIAQGNKEILFVSGVPGIGKSMLINEVQKPILKEKGFFLAGKFDQFKRNIPYTGIRQAFEEAIKQLLTRSEAEIQKWKTDLLNALGSNGKLVSDLIPELELIIGAQPDVESLSSAQEALNRFNLVFSKFVKVFATIDHPVVLFVDDLQWADNPSLALIESLLSDSKLNYFFFIGSYRDNEVDLSHPFSKVVKNIEALNISYSKLHIAPLNKPAVNDLLQESFSADEGSIMELGNVVHSKAGGNPFYIKEFLKSLYDSELLKFEKGWTWDIQAIQSANITENVVDLMASRIKKLSSETLDVLKVAACIGVEFDIKALTYVYEKSEDETVSNLKEAVSEGLILKVGDETRFVHDKVREAAYSLLSSSDKAQYHHKIGKLLLSHSDSHEVESNVFDIVNQLNLAGGLLSPEETNKVIELNMKAGQKAKSSIAYQSAVHFFSKAVDLLSPGSWEKKYNLTFDLYFNLAEAQFLSVNYEEAEKLFEAILKNVKDKEHYVQIYLLKIDYYLTVNNPEEALNQGMIACKLMSIKIPKKVGPLSIIGLIMKVNGLVGKKEPMSFLDVPSMTDEDGKLKIKILRRMASPANYTNQTLFMYIILQILVFTLELGNANTSSFSYVVYGVVLYTMGKAEKGAQFAEVAMKLAEKFDDKRIFGQTIFGAVVALLIRDSVKDTIMTYNRGGEYGMEVGDFLYAYYNYTYGAIFLLFSENSIDSVVEEMDGIYSSILKLKLDSIVSYFSWWKKLVQTLSNESEIILSLDTDVFKDDIDEILNSPKMDDVTLSNYCACKVMSCYLFNDLEGIQNLLKIFKKISGNMGLQPFKWITYSFYCLTLLQICEGHQDRAKYIKEVKKFYKMIKDVANQNPQRFKSKELLLKAELGRVEGVDFIKVATFYEDAIREAKNNGHILESALANECAAKFYLSAELSKICISYMVDARYAYLKWGAHAKVLHLEKTYPHLFKSLDDYTGKVDTAKANMASATVSAARSSKGRSSTTGSGFLDLGTVMKASAVMASEINMEKLLSKTIKILMENAGAQKGMLILPDDEGRLFIEAFAEIADTDQEMSADAISVLQSIPLDEAINLSPAIVRYVSKTKENVVLDNASEEGRYVNDAYVKKEQPLSVLCIPIINQGRLVAVLYLENDLMPSAFPERRVELLNVLSTQAAISIENARLIQNLTEQERLKKEMEIAENIQTSLCPPPPDHPELELGAVMKAAEEVGGDYYDITYDNKQNLWFAIGDVTGHGLTPGLVMMMAQTSFNTSIRGGDVTPKDAISLVNTILHTNIRNRLQERHFMTMNFMKYLGKGKFIQSGSHEDIVIYRAKTKKCEAIKTKGVYLGITSNIEQALSNDELTLEKEDIMVIYTDGVIEAKNSNEELLDPAGLFKIIESNTDKSCQELADIITQETLDWCNHVVADDITMIVCRMK